jgi:hypothetical protein
MIAYSIDERFNFLLLYLNVKFIRITFKKRDLENKIIFLKSLLNNL